MAARRPSRMDRAFSRQRSCRYERGVKFVSDGRARSVCRSHAPKAVRHYRMLRTRLCCAVEKDTRAASGGSFGCRGRPDDAPRHDEKADTPHLRRLWSEVANKVLTDTGDEGRASLARFTVSSTREAAMSANASPLAVSLAEMPRENDRFWVHETFTRFPAALRKRQPSQH